jgi:hypothetical protein
MVWSGATTETAMALGWRDVRKRNVPPGLAVSI